MATPVANSIPLSGEPRIDGIVQGGSWVFSGPRVLSYSFNINDARDASGNIVPGSGGNWAAPQMNAFSRALATFGAVANVSFEQISSGTYYFESTADIAATLTGNELQILFGAIGIGVFPDPVFTIDFPAIVGHTPQDYPRMEGDLFFDNFYPGFSYLSDGGTGFDLMLHEIGHALGLKHPHDDGGNDRPSYAGLGLSAYDSNVYSVMSYADPRGSANDGHTATPMLHDILAIQHIYGANMSYRVGDDAYALNSYYSTIWDAGGADTIDATSWAGTTGVTIDLRPGSFSGTREGTKTTAIAYNVTIENAIGTSGADQLIGNDAANSLAGRGGNDSLDGGAGADTLSGGSGNDIFVVDDPAEEIVESADEGTDLVQSAVSYALPANVEKLTLTGSGSTDAIGNAGDNVLTGNAGDNVLDGGPGFDFFAGAQGNDRYVVDSVFPAYSLVIQGAPGEQVSAGESVAITSGVWTDYNAFDSSGDGLVDFVRIYISGGAHNWIVAFSTDDLGQNLVPGTYANAQRAGFAQPGHPGLDVSGDGRGSNAVFGNFVVHEAQFDYATFSPRLVSFSATFEQHSESPTAPALTGTVNYNYASAEIEIVTELPGEGTDTIESWVSARLPANVENLVLAGAGDIDARGNSAANRITGNSGNNLLDGAGGIDIAEYSAASAGVIAELWKGTAGNDGQGGTDTLVGIEDLGGGAFNDLLAGDEGSNRLAGDAGDDLLEAGGGGDVLLGEAGADVLRGGAGDDTLDGGPGVDTADYSTAAAVTAEIWRGRAEVDGEGGVDALVAIENLFGSNGNDLLAGDEGANSLYGNGGDDLLASGGGADVLVGEAGDDILRGGGGSDTLDGGIGADTGDFSTAAAAVTAEIWRGRADVDGDGGADILIGIENLFGSVHDDLLVGDEGSNRLFGNAGDDHILGGGAADFLNGEGGDDILRGGAGADTLVGAHGRDTFVFDTAPAPGDIDQITDFSVADDTIVLWHSVFGGFPNTGTPGSDYLIYDSTSGALFYDGDGPGAASSPVQMAVLIGAPALGDGDFMIA